MPVLHHVEPDQIHGSLHRETAADPPAIGVDLVTFALETQGSREEIMHHLLKFQVFHSQSSKMRMMYAPDPCRLS